MRAPNKVKKPKSRYSSSSESDSIISQSSDLSDEDIRILNQLGQGSQNQDSQHEYLKPNEKLDNILPECFYIT